MKEYRGKAKHRRTVAVETGCHRRAELVAVQWRVRLLAVPLKRQQGKGLRLYLKRSRLCTVETLANNNGLDRMNELEAIQKHAQHRADQPRRQNIRGLDRMTGPN